MDCKLLVLVYFVVRFLACVSGGTPKYSGKEDIAYFTGYDVPDEPGEPIFVRETKFDPKKHEKNKMSEADVLINGRSTAAFHHAMAHSNKPSEMDVQIAGHPNPILKAFVDAISQSEQGNNLGNQATKTELNPVIPKNLIRKPASFFRVSNITYPIDKDGSVIKSSQAITFAAQFPVKANVPYGRKAGRPAHIENQSLLAIDHSKQTNDIDYEKAKIDTWTETVLYEDTKLLAPARMRLLSIQDKGVLPKKEAKKAEPFTIEILFTEQDELKIVGPRKKLSDGYFLGWLSNIRFGSYDFLHTIELSNISVDSNSCHYLLGLIERNAGFLYKLKFYHCTYPKEMWKMVSGDEFKKMKYLHTFQLVTPTLEMEEVLDLVDKFPNTLKELSIGDFDFGEQYMEGISFIGKLGRLKELYLLHLYYFGDPLFEKMVDLGLSKEMREELRNFKMSNMNNGPFVRTEAGKESEVMNEIAKRRKEGRM